MHQFEKSKSPYHKLINKKKLASNVANGHTFSIYNPEILSFNNTQIKLERAKDELMKLQNHFNSQRQELSVFTSELEMIKTELTKNFMAIQSIIIISQQNSKRNDDTQGVIEEEVLIPSYPMPLSPLMKPCDYVLMNLLEQHNLNMEKQIIAKNNELIKLKQTEKVARYTKLNNNYNNHSIQLMELRKNYELLKFQSDELQYRLSKTIEERNRYEALGERYKMYCASYLSIKEDDLSSKHLSANAKGGSSNSNQQGISEEAKKAISDLKKENEKLRKQIMELNYLNMGYNDKANIIQKQMSKKDKDINYIKTVLNKSEGDLNVMPTTTSHNTNDLNQVIAVLNKEIETHNGIYNDMNNDYIQKVMEIKKTEDKCNDLENELDKHKTQNMALDEILQEERIHVLNLQDIAKNYKEKISELEREFNQLKKPI